MAWGKAGSETTTSTGDITVSSLTDSKFLQILSNPLPSGNISGQYRLNSDTGSNYAYRYNDDGGSDGTGTSSSGMTGGIGGSGAANPYFSVGYLFNISSEEKLLIYHCVGRNSSGAGTAPKRREAVAKWANTSDAVSSITERNVESGSFASDSNLTVLGSDMTPAAAIPFVENVPSGSRFEETDTRKFYTKDLNGWQEKGTALGYRHDSTYEQINPLTTVNKQHFVEWFSGKQIPSYWTRTDVETYATGTGTDGMVDAVDEGAFVKTGSTQYNISILAFNNKRQYNPSGSRVIGVVKRVTSNTSTSFGLYNLLTDGSYNSANLDNDTRNSVWRATSGTATTPSTTLTSVPINTVFNLLDIVLGSSDIKFSINGSLQVTKTTDLPTAKLQPRLYTLTLTGANAESRCKYCEAYNT